MLKFPEMHDLAPGVEPLSFKVFGLSIKSWKIVHIVSSLAFMIFTALHIYFNREWVKKVGSKKLNLNVVVGLLIGIFFIIAAIIAPPA